MKKSTRILAKIKRKSEALLYGKVLKSLLSLSRAGLNTVSGKADAGLSIDHLYRDRPKGLFRMGRMLDGVLLQLPAVKATRKKKDIIIKILQNEVSNNILLNKKTKILDIASGPARYLVDFIEKMDQENDALEVLCIDNDKRSVNYGNIIGRDKPIRFVKADVFRLGVLKRFSNRIGWKPNLILCTGFLELNADEHVRKILRDIFEFIDEGGLLLFTSQIDNPQKKLMKKMGRTQKGCSWRMHFRSTKLLREWLLEIGFRDVIISVDKWGMYEYCTGRKY